MFLKLFSSALEAVVHINLMISLFRATPRNGEGDEEEEEEEEEEDVTCGGRFILMDDISESNAATSRP